MMAWQDTPNNDPCPHADACMYGRVLILTLTYKYSAKNEHFTHSGICRVDWAKLWKDVFVRWTRVRSALVDTKASCI